MAFRPFSFPLKSHDVELLGAVLGEERCRSPSPIPALLRREEVEEPDTFSSTLEAGSRSKVYHFYVHTI